MTEQEIQENYRIIAALYNGPSGARGFLLKFLPERRDDRKLVTWTVGKSGVYTEPCIVSKSCSTKK